MTTTLSTRESAGLYLVRRARTLTAPHQLRLVATAVVAVLVVDLGRIQLLQLESGTPMSWSSFGCGLLTYTAIALVLWRPRAGMCAAAVALVAGLATGGTGTEPALLVVVGAVASARGTRRLVGAFLAGVVAYLAVTIALHPEYAVFYLTWFSGAAVVGTAVGLAGRALSRLGDRKGRHLAEMAGEDARLRADERRLLASELHDVVTHQLSNISLQVMSHLDSTDVDELHKVMKKVNRATDSALTELRLLVRVLRDYPTTAAATDEVAGLSRRVPPTQAAAGWARQLIDAGFDPEIDIPAQSDRLETTVQATISRTLDVTCDNVLRHAPARSRCAVSISLSPTQVVVRAASPLPSQPASGASALGWGLRGLRERVDLTGGTFSAGSSTLDDPEWVVVVTLPRD